MTKKNYESKIETMRKELRKKESVAEIISKIEENMKWDAMKYHGEEEDEEKRWTEPTEDDWEYDKFLAYKEVLEVLDKHFFK